MGFDRQSGNFVKVVDEAINPLNYGAIGNGVTLDDAAFAATMAAASGVRQPHVYLPPRYRFRLSAPLPLINGLHLEGPGSNNDCIVNDVSDVFTLAGTNSRAHIHDFGVIASAGHIFNPDTQYFTQCHFHDLWLQITNPAKSVFIGTGGLVDSVLEDLWIVGAPARTQPIVSFISNGNLNDNTFRNWRMSDSAATTWAILLQSTGGYAIGNKLECLNFENPAGGAIRLLSGKWCVLDRIFLWDISDTIVNDLISLGSGGGQSCRYNDVIRVYRNAGTIAPHNDISIEGSGQGYSTRIRDCGSGAADFTINGNSAVDLTVERCPGAIIKGTVATATVQASAGTGATATLVTGSSQVDGIITLTTGSAAMAVGDILQIKIGTNGSLVTPIGVSVTPMDATTQAAGLYVPYSSISVTGFNIAVASALPTGTTVHIGYRVARAMGA